MHGSRSSHDHRTLAKIAGWFLEGVTRWVISRADGAVYVTQDTLQRRYPTRAPQLAMTDARLPQSWLELESVAIRSSLRSIVTVGHLNGGVKGIDVLLQGFSAAVSAGLDDASLTIVGAGDPEPFMRLAKGLGIMDRVTFAGSISDRTELLDLLRTQDLFVLASRSEGLPRAMIEAMSLGLPCIGSRVGGVEELVGRQWSFESGDHEGLAELLLSICVLESRSALAREQQSLARALIMQAQDAPLVRFLDLVGNRTSD